MSEADAVWAETTAGGLLHQMFGAYPNLHDANVHSVTFDRATDSLTMDVDYTDRGVEGEANLRVRIHLIWTGLKEVDLSVNDTEIVGIEFRKEYDLLRTELESGFGIAGTILSEGFEALLEKVDPPDRENSEEQHLGIRYR